jgi:hypothetical protein
MDFRAYFPRPSPIPLLRTHFPSFARIALLSAERWSTERCYFMSTPKAPDLAFVARIAEIVTSHDQQKSKQGDQAE